MLHDLDSSANHNLERHLLSAVIDQNRILQGYYAVKILESILETGEPPKAKRLEIVHSLVLGENRNLFRNHRRLTKMID